MIALALGCGLIPALIGANKAMVKTLAGREDAEEEEDPENIRHGNSFDPTLTETKHHQYAEDRCYWTGPSLCLHAVCIQTDPPCQYCCHPGPHQGC